MISGVGGRSNLSVQALVDMRRQLDDLQRQLGSGKKSTTYAGLGPDRGLATSLRAQVSGLENYDQTIKMLDVRIELSQTVLTRMTKIRGEAKGLVQQPAAVKPSGQSAAQETARNQLSELLELLNTDVNGRHLFAGRAFDQKPVESIEHILDGDGSRAGLKQVIAERAQADLGAGLGRLVVTGAPGSVTLAEDIAGSVFGFKLAAVSSNLTGATVTGPASSPPQIGVTFAAPPNAGEQLTVTLNLPDGSTETVTLTATTASPAGPNEFTIDPDPNTTAANFQAALSTSLTNAAGTSLAAASAAKASDDFFNIGPGDPPMRVAGPPFASATAMVAGTPANTVTWYTGELATDSARSSAVARVDTAITVSYGMRASEEGIRSLVQNLAAFAATTFDPNAAETPARYAELTERLLPVLSNAEGGQRVEDIVADLAHGHATAGAAEDRHQQATSLLGGLLNDIEGIPPEEVAATILTLQTRLQASLQTTAMLYQMNLTNYL